MGTRSLTFVYKAKNEKPFLCMYRQFDGYKEGHGQELAMFLVPITVINGIGGEKAGAYANGMGCLAAQMVAHFKGPHGIGGFYLHSPETKDAGQEYEYHVFPNEVKVFENVWNGPDKMIFSGTWKAFADWTGAVIAPAPTAKPEYETLRDALQHEVVTVTFTKADDTTRVMRCTTDPARIPEDKLSVTTQKPLRVDRKLYKVFDLDKQDWRAFREERLIDWDVE